MDYGSTCVMVEQSVLVYFADLLQNQLHKVLSFCYEKLHIIKKGKCRQLGYKMSPTPANEHANNYLSHQIIQQKKTLIYVDRNPVLGEAQTIWRS